jgi:hypothetical protein
LIRATPTKIFKRFNIEYGKAMFTNSAENI